MRTSGLFGIVSFCVCSVAACVGDDVGPRTNAVTDGGSSSGLPQGDAGASIDGASASSLSVTPARLRITRGQPASAIVTLNRNGLAGDVTVSAIDLPMAVTSSPIVVPSGETTRMLTLNASAMATQGRTSIRLRAEGIAELPVELVVAGVSGSIDESFDGDGYVLTDTISGLYYGMTVQPDGKVLAVGTQDPAGGAWVIRRFNEDGSPDVAFNSAALASTPATGSARAVAVDTATGRVVIVGQSSTRLTLVRRNANGTADQSFGSAGTLVVDSVTHPSGSIGYALTVLPGSSIVVAGSRNTMPVGIVERYTAAGVRDSAFVHYAMPNEGVLNAVFQTFGGALIATGTNKVPSPQSQLVTRLLSNGTPDASFSGGSRSYAALCSGLGAALVGVNANVIIVGQDISGPNPCQSRLDASGTGSLYFTRNTGNGTSDRFTSAAGASDAEFSYAVGYGGGTLDRYAMIERRSAVGDLDTQFGATGRLLFEDPATPDTYRFELHASATMADGRLLVAGQRITNMPVAAKQFAIARVWP